MLKTPSQITVEYLKMIHGNINTIADIYDVSRQTVYGWKKNGIPKGRRAAIFVYLKNRGMEI